MPQKHERTTKGDISTGDPLAAADEQMDNPPTSEPGDGPAGRQRIITTADMKERTPRKGDDTLPRCPACSTADVAVLCLVGRTQGIVRYHYCPMRCGYSAKRIDRISAEKMVASRYGPQRIQRPFVERPLDG